MRGVVGLMRFPNVAIAGIPGSGKTTLANGLCRVLGYRKIDVHKLAVKVDPDCIEEGRMADPEKFRVAFLEEANKPGYWVADGIPRYQSQAEYLPAGTHVIYLHCDRTVAIDRLRDRGRPDDKPGMIEQRVDDAIRMLEVEHPGGWIRKLAGWSRCLNVTRRNRETVLSGVVAFLQGSKREVF